MARDIRRIVATDCGSTTTKAILIEKSPTTGEYRLVARGWSFINEVVFRPNCLSSMRRLRA